MSFFKTKLIKKRTIISILITAIVLFATNGFWLVFKPYTVNFDIEGVSKCNLKVILNKKNDDIFKRVKSDDIDVNLKKTSHIVLNVDRMKFPKRIKIIFSNLDTENNLAIDNISLTEKKIKLDKLDKFKISGATYSIKDNKLILKPNDSKITLVYKDKLNVKPDICFDYYLFIIIFVLTFLLSRKIADYVADFKVVDKKSRIDIIFLVIFFLFLFVPMSDINNDEISKDENRTLAKWKSFVLEKGEINYNFGKDFENWFNDRFALREFFINTYNKKMLLSKNWISKDVIRGKEDWLFLNSIESKNSFTNSVMFKENELSSILNYLNEINDYYKKRNKSFYFIIAPDKSRIYGEKYNDSIKRVQEYSKTDQLIDYIRKNSDIKVIYPKDTLLKHKNDGLIYWKNDTHWNLMGAYYGYMELLNVIKNDYKNLNEYKIKKYVEETHIGDLYNMTPDSLKIEDKTTYRVPDIKQDKLCKKPEELYGDVVCKNKNGNLNLLMYRDSFSESLIPYLAHTFKNSKYVWTYDVIPNDMKEADIVVLEVIERLLLNIVDRHIKVQ